LLHDEQQAQKGRVELADDAPMLLPFLRPETPAPRGRRIIRKDPAAPPAGPHPRQSTPHKRHA